jgi:tetratricopeptide (TPR) repeat protein
MRDSSDFYQFTLARIYWKQQRLDTALQCFERAIALNPERGESFDLAADCSFKLGDRRKGERYAKEARHRGAFQAYARWQNGDYGKF